MSFTCDLCKKEFKDFSTGGYIQNLTIHCPDCDKRPGIPVRIVGHGKVRTVYVKTIKEGLDLVGGMR